MMTALALSIELEGSTPKSARALYDPQAIVWATSAGSETPSPYSIGALLDMESATGQISLHDDLSYVVEKASKFMEAAATVLSYSEAADAAGDALVKRIRSSAITKHLTRKISE